MNVLATLLWLEYRRTAWVLYGALVGLALFALVLLSLPGVITGFDVLNLPLAGSESICQPPHCKSSGNSSLRMTQENADGHSSSSWSYSNTWGDESADVEDKEDPSVIPVPIPEELQVAFRPRQAATAATVLGLTALLLLGFWIAHHREADRGEMVTLYQSPVSGDRQLVFRFCYMSGVSAISVIAVLAIYWIVQTSQALAPLAPILEAFGGHAYIHWGSLILAIFTTQILPNVAFVLLFVQMQNAYRLLGGQRLVGLLLTLAALSLSISSFVGSSPDPESSSALLHIVSIESTPSLDGAIDDFEPSRYRIDLPFEVIVLGAGVTILMLFLAGRVWREVEWS